jgi:hypothetical protein
MIPQRRALDARSIIYFVDSGIAHGGGVMDAARSANIFEQEFWMSGPRYSGKVPLCEQHEPLKSNRAPLQHQGGKVLEWI